MWEVRHQNHGENGEGFRPGANILDPLPIFLVEGANTKRLSKITVDSGSVCTMLADSKSHRSRYFLAKIWLIILAGIGKKPRPTTKGCCIVGPDGWLENNVLTPTGMERGKEEQSDIRGFERLAKHEATKVETKDGKT